MRSTSASNWTRNPFAVAPPSTRSDVAAAGAGRRRRRASGRRSTRARPGRGARAACPRVMPLTRPRASGAQCGEPSPVSAGTKYDPVAGGDRPGERLALGGVGEHAEPVAEPLHRGAGDEDRPLERVARRARAGDVAAAVRTSPCRRRRAVGAARGEHERPRSRTSPSPRRARSSRGRRARPAGRPRARRRAPHRAERAPRRRSPPRAATSGRSSRPTPKSASSSSSQSSDASPSSIVRDAFETSVAWTAPPVSRHRSHESTVPNGEAAGAPRPSRAGSTRASWRRSTGRASAPCARGSRRPAAPGSARRCAGPARRSRGATGAPLGAPRRRSSRAGSRSRSRRPRAAATPASASAASAAASTLRQSSSGSCSTQPGRGSLPRRGRVGAAEHLAGRRRRRGRSSRWCPGRPRGSRTNHRLIGSSLAAVKLARATAVAAVAAGLWTAVPRAAPPLAAASGAYRLAGGGLVALVPDGRGLRLVDYRDRGAARGLRSARRARSSAGRASR